MQRYITTQQTPVYRYDGSTYTAVDSYPVGTEVDFASISTIAGRPVGTLPDGKRMFLDNETLAVLLSDSVKVTAKRMYLGLAALGVAIGSYQAYKYWQRKKKRKKK